MGRTSSNAQQFNDVETGHFFIGVVFTAADLAVELPRCRPVRRLADRFRMDWQMRDRATRRR